MKTSIKCKNNEFLVIIVKHVNHLGTRKMCAIAHENGRKDEKNEFLVITLKHVPGHIPMRIPLERQNCGQYLMKMAIKHENEKFLFTHSNMYRVLRSF